MIRSPIGDFYAYVEFVDNVAYRDLTKDQILGLIPGHYTHTFLIFVDQTTIA